MNYFIGLDVGTSGAKTILINSRGKVISSAASEYKMYNPKALWSEQNPEDWWRAVQKSFKEVISNSGIKNSDIKGVGLTGQMHGLVLLDNNSNVLRPCIMWNDQRTVKECEEITNKIGFNKLLKITGNPVLPGFTAPKILWVKNHEPEVYEKTAHILLPKDYIRFCLTGEFATDVSDASGTALLDVNKRSWSKEILNQLEMPEQWLPEVYESPDVTGEISREAERKTGLKEGTIVIAGGGDQAAGGVGSGTVEEGITSVVLGTSGVVFSHTDKLTVQPEGKLHAFCHAVPDAWHVMGVTLSAAGSFKWYKEIFGDTEKDKASKQKKDVYDILIKQAEKIPAGSEGLFFLPYLSGERTPHPDPDAKGTFTGFTIRHTKNNFTRAVIEGITFSLRDCLELNRNLGLKANQIRASGGGAKNRFWLQLLADAFNTEIVTLNSTEGAPYGAALLAAVGAGEFKNVKEACNSCIKIKSGFKPKKKNVNLYNDFYNIYKNLYPALKNSFKEISNVVEKHGG